MLSITSSISIISYIQIELDNGTKKEILSFSTTWMDHKDVMLGEISQRQILYDIFYNWNPKKYELTKAESKIVQN